MRNETKPAYGWRIKTLVFIFLISVIGFIHVKSEPKKHSVIKGDTLWDISGAYYKNPWKWKEIWSVNRDSIRDPDLIYPAQIFSIPGLAQGGVAVSRAESSKNEAAFEEELMAELEAEVEDTESVPVEEELMAELEAETTGEMEAEVEDTVSADEVSAESTEEESALEEELAAELEAEGEIEEELMDELEAEVEDTVSADEVSAIEFELEEAIEEEIAEEPEEVEEEIEEEEIIKPVITEEIDWDADSFVVPRKFSFDGKIIRDKERKILIGQMDIVYINVGTSQGLKPDGKCYVLRKMGTVKSGYLVKKVGMVKATNAVSEHTSTVIVIKSYEPIRVGDLIQIVE